MLHVRLVSSVRLQLAAPRARIGARTESKITQEHLRSTHSTRAAGARETRHTATVWPQRATQRNNKVLRWLGNSRQVLRAGQVLSY